MYSILFILSLFFIKSYTKLKQIDAIWKKYTTFLNYKKLELFWDEIFIPWKKPFPILKNFLNNIDQKYQQKITLIPHAPLYDCNNFKDKESYEIFKDLKKIYPHKNYAIQDDNNKNKLTIEPNYSKAINVVKPNICKKDNEPLKVLYLSQNSLEEVLDEEPYLSNVVKNLKYRWCNSLKECKVERFKFDSNQMCYGDITNKDFKSIL